MAAAQRKEESGSKNSICAREMCQILTRGTLVEEASTPHHRPCYSLVQAHIAQDMLEGPDANVLLVVHEDTNRRISNFCFTFAPPTTHA